MRDIFEELRTLKGRKRKELLQAIELENKSHPRELIQIGFPKGEPGYRGMVELWRSRDYMLQVHIGESPKIERLTIHRTALNSTGTRWLDNISWDTIQRLKHECGRGHLAALEVFPPDQDVINVANMRHIWIFKSASDLEMLDDLGMIWKNARCQPGVLLNQTDYAGTILGGGV